MKPITEASFLLTFKEPEMKKILLAIGTTTLLLSGAYAQSQTQEAAPPTNTNRKSWPRPGRMRSRQASNRSRMAAPPLDKARA
ncbi:hypothetical protein [Variovorax gossypii]